MKRSVKLTLPVILVFTVLVRHARLAKVLLRQDVGGNLAPVLRDVDVVELEHQRAVRIADLGAALVERDVLVRRLALSREPTRDLHLLDLLLLSLHGTLADVTRTAPSG